MENHFPKIDLFPRLTRIGRAVGRFLTVQQLASHGDHFLHEERGGGPALDRELYDQPQLEYADPTQPLNRWDSEGTYLDRE